MNPFTKSFVVLFLIPAISIFAQSGCTDYQASNYDPNAVINDGSCVYPYTSIPLTFKTYIDSIELNETSGLVNAGNNFWTHVDDSNNSIYRIDTLSPSIFQKVTINNSTNNDWEDISSDSSHIYVGDIGNNDGNRTNLRFYKILKSDITPSSTTVNAGRINYTYADQVNFTICHNCNYYECEAFFILNDSIHLFTKGWVNKWTKHYVVPADTGNHIAQLVDSFYVGGLITSAAIQGDSMVVLLGLNFYGATDCFVWMLTKFDGTNFFSGNKRRFNIGSVYTTGQTEAICFRDTNKCYITNERLGSVPNQLRAFDLSPYLAPPPPVPIITTSATAVNENLRACSDSGFASFIIRNTSTFAGQDLTFSLSGYPAWLTASPVSDTIAPEDSAVITLHFNSGTLPGGTYITNVSIQSNDPYHPVKTINVTLYVDNNPCLDYFFSSDSCTGIINFTTSSINIPSYYHWDFGDGDTSNIPNPSHSYITNGNYITTLIGCNAAGCDTVIQNVQAMINGPKPAICYPVTQTYCCGIGITHVHITGPAGDVINNTSNDASVSFEDFSCVVPGTMITNEPYAITCTTATTYAEYLKVWLDMNNDGMLDSVSEELFSDLDTVAPVHTGIFTIPALSGNIYGIPLRMRVASDFQHVPQPCINPQYGQDEDYSVILNFSVEVNESSGKTDLKIFPNPFTHSTSIDYTIKKSSNVRLEVFNILGERVVCLVNAQIQSAGQYRYQFTQQPPGIYFVKLSVNDKSIVEKIVKTN